MMKSGNRLSLMLCAALIASACFVAPSSAQKGEVAALSAKIAELSRAGKYSEAMPLAQRQLESLEKKYGSVNGDVAGALNNLAQLYGSLGNDAEAEPLFKRSIAIMEKTVGLDSPEIAPELNNLAALFQRQERYAEAEPLFKRALAVREKSLPSGHPDRGTFDRLKSDPKMGRAEALRQAMLGYLNDASSPNNAYPALWGPFALIGEGAAR